MPRCRAIRRDGEPCRAFAADPDGYCLFHSPTKPWDKAKNEPVSDEELEKTLTRELRAVRKQKRLSPLERAREVRALTQLILSIRSGGPPSAEPGNRDFDQRLKRWKNKQPLNENA